MYFALDDHNDFIEWSLQGNGQTHDDKNLQKMKLDHYIMITGTGKTVYRKGNELHNIRILWSKYPSNEAKITFIEEAETIKVIELRIDKQNKTFEIIP